jgi:hypothetical protein
MVNCAKTVPRPARTVANGLNSGTAFESDLTRPDSAHARTAANPPVAAVCGGEDRPISIRLASSPRRLAPVPVVEVAPSSPPAFNDAALIRARKAMATLGTTLKQTLVAKMSTDGPTAALDVCSQDAVSLTASVAANSGSSVGRSSLRLRNTMMPDLHG